LEVKWGNEKVKEGKREGEIERGEGGRRKSGLPVGRCGLRSGERLHRKWLDAHRMKEKVKWGKEKATEGKQKVKMRKGRRVGGGAGCEAERGCIASDLRHIRWKRRWSEEKRRRQKVRRRWDERGKEGTKKSGPDRGFIATTWRR
jgi:hypothetical protein